MTHRPFPSIARARHQLDRHDDETGPRSAEPRAPLTTVQAVERWVAMVKAATPTGEQLAASWTAAFRPRPVGSEEKTA